MYTVLETENLFEKMRSKKKHTAKKQSVTDGQG